MLIMENKESVLEMCGCSHGRDPRGPPNREGVGDAFLESYPTKGGMLIGERGHKCPR